MAYQALYRKFRPQDFESVKGQDHIVTTLKNQIKADRIGHAYLFTGTRGTGKTTVAKLFAKAVNCANPGEDGSPCGVCPVCKAIADGTSMNVREIDAASNNGVDSIRELIEDVSYAPTEGKYKVYILDEVHMLSTSAFNAFLKTLEEPPAHAIFIMATTEIHKVPITILSRCQRYDFRRISTETIKDRLANIMKSEGIEVEEKGLMYIAKVADGSMRDALSLLDECTAFYMDQTLTYDKILSVLGAVDTEIFYRLFEAIRKEDVLSAVDIVNDIVMEGRDIRQFVLDFTWYIRNMLLVKNMDSMEDILDMSTDTLNTLKEEAKDMPEEVLMRFIRVLSDLSNSLRDATQKRVLLEITVIKLCKPAMEQDYESLIQRMTSMEQRMESGAFTVAAVQSPAETAEKKTAPIDPGLKKSLPEATPEAVKEAAREFKAIIQDAPGMTKKFLEAAMVTVSDEGELMLVFDLIDNIQHMAYKMFQDPEKIAELEDLISEHIEQQVKVVVRGNETVTPKENLYTDAITAFAGKNGVVIETEDF